MNELMNYNNTIFERIKHVDENGFEYWEARELQRALEYKQWRRFENVIDKAKISCKKSKIDINKHFANVGKSSINVNGGKRIIKDYKLSRYACYLITQNGDPRKKVIALGQSYFAIKTRQMELIEKDYDLMSEDERRLYNRELTKKGNLSLNRTAANAGVRNFPKFTNAGYKGLYNGETADDIARRKGLKYREYILDNMCSEELGANIFRITQTEAKLKREKINNENDAIDTHYNVGKIVRKAIKETNLVYDDVDIKDKIYIIRDKQVMLDSDLAKLYKCKNGTKTINLAVKRNIDRFPEDFYFQLTEEEVSRFQIETLNKKRDINLFKILTMPLRILNPLQIEMQELYLLFLLNLPLDYMLMLLS